MTPLTRPGNDRGLGRYVTAVHEAAQDLGYRVAPIALKHRSGRLSQFLDLVDRQNQLTGFEFDVFHATNPYVTVVRATGKTVASILDVIPLDVAEYRQTAIKAQLFFRLAARADHILTLSEFSAGRIHRVLRVPEDHITVAPLPPCVSFRPDPAADDPSIRELLPETPYFCAVADFRTRDPRKRLHWLADIARALSARGHRLVVVGHCTDTWRDAPALGIGAVTDDQLATVYRHACALVYTSAYEGQGLPAIEAMACGTPVVAMRNSAVAEGVGGGGILVSEDDGSGLEAGPRRLVDACVGLAASPRFRANLSERALAQSARFTMERFRAGLARAYADEGRGR
jgi:glycosyltransferase involved in cell wall biosynthesis